MGAPNTNYAVDITEQWEIKLNALRAHESQLAERFEFIENMLKEWATKAGEKYGMTYAEGFHRAENF